MIVPVNSGGHRADVGQRAYYLFISDENLEDHVNALYGDPEKTMHRELCATRLEDWIMQMGTTLGSGAQGTDATMSSSRAVRARPAVCKRTHLPLHCLLQTVCGETQPEAWIRVVSIVCNADYIHCGYFCIVQGR